MSLYDGHQLYVSHHLYFKSFVTLLYVTFHSRAKEKATDVTFAGRRDTSPNPVPTTLKSPQG